MINNKYILVDKKPVLEPDFLKWGKWFEEASENGERIVKQETLPNGKFVSTVFLGLDHNFGEGEPLLFETMVFAPEEKTSKGGLKYHEDLDMERYSTWEESEIGHLKMIHRHK